MPKKPIDDNNDRPDAGQLTRRAQQRVDTRNQVYEAAIEEFKRTGITNTQIEAIVNRAGVSVGTFYRYFTGRDDVLRELQRRNAAVMIDRVAQARMPKDLGKFLQKMLHIVLIEPPPPEVVLEREALSIVVRSPHEIDYATHPIFGLVIARLKAGQEAGLVRTDISALLLGKIFFHKVFGIIAGTLREQRKPDEINALLDVYLRGISQDVKN